MLETIFSLLLLVNGTTTPLTYNCSGIATSSNCIAGTPTASTTLTLSVNVPVGTIIVEKWATTTIYATTTVEKIVYRNATSSRHWWEWERQNATTTPATTTTIIKYVERVVEKIKYVPVYQCPATTTPPIHYSTTTPDYTKPPKIEKIEAKIEKQIEKIEERQERMIDRMNNVFERMINRLNKMLERI